MMEPEGKMRFSNRWYDFNHTFHRSPKETLQNVTG